MSQIVVIDRSILSERVGHLDERQLAVVLAGIDLVLGRERRVAHEPSLIVQKSGGTLWRLPERVTAGPRCGRHEVEAGPPPFRPRDTRASSICAGGQTASSRITPMRSTASKCAS